MLFKLLFSLSRLQVSKLNLAFQILPREFVHNYLLEIYLLNRILWMCVAVFGLLRVLLYGDDCGGPEVGRVGWIRLVEAGLN